MPPETRGARAGCSIIWRVAIAARGTRRNTHRNATRVTREPRTSVVIHQPDRESFQPSARDRTAGQTLAERNHGAALDCGWGVGSRAWVPQDNWLSRDAPFGCRATRSRYQ